MKKLIVFASVMMMSSAYADKWDKTSNPSYFEVMTGGKMNFEMRDLPLDAKLQDDRMGWSETFWPSDVGGIAYRWNSTNPF